MKKILFSIVIPVYRVEDYLVRCVDSILTQSYSNFEVILVDDGSPDKCPIICDTYSQKDCRIKVFHQENMGLSAARNTGIQQSCGDYILFVDSDDYWDSSSALLDIYNCLLERESDIILLPFKKNNLEKNICSIVNSSYDVNYLFSSDKSSVLSYLFEHNLFPGSAWSVCVNLNVIKKDNVFFTVGIKAEDFDWLIHLFLVIQTVAAVTTPFYVYNVNREGSITSTSDIKSIESLLFIIDKWHQTLLATNQKYLLNHLSFIYITIFATYGKLSSSLKKTLYPQIRNRSYILRYACTKRNKYLAFLLRVLGFNLFSFGLKLYRSR